MAQFAISTTLPAPVERVWALLQRPETLVYVSRGWLGFRPIDPPQLPDTWPPEGGDFTVRLLGLGVLPLGRQVLGVRFPPCTPPRYEVQDQGRGSLVRVWDHRIVIEPAGNNACRYTDHLTLDAGLLTPVITLWAKGFYRHRQRRWHRLLETRAGTA